MALSQLKSNGCKIAYPPPLHPYDALIHITIRDEPILINFIGYRFLPQERVGSIRLSNSFLNTVFA